jgi:hypothetical protein
VPKEGASECRPGLLAQCELFPAFDYPSPQVGDHRHRAGDLSRVAREAGPVQQMLDGKIDVEALSQHAPGISIGQFMSPCSSKLLTLSTMWSTRGRIQDSSAPDVANLARPPSARISD